MTNQDNIYSVADPKKGSFCFDQSVADVFDDMITRSVPFYTHLQALIVRFVCDYSVSGYRVYDVGCSTGNTIKMCCSQPNGCELVYVGIDKSEEMLTKARQKVSDCVGKISFVSHDLTCVY